MFINQAAYGTHSDSTNATPPSPGQGWYSPMQQLINKLSSYGYPITLCVNASCT